MRVPALRSSICTIAAVTVLVRNAADDSFYETMHLHLRCRGYLCNKRRVVNLTLVKASLAAALMLAFC